jgi:anti-anti-sigma factor
MSETLYRHLKASSDQGVLVVTITEPKLQGDAMAESIRDEFLEAVAASGGNKVVLDLRNLTYLSSAGFRPFLNLRVKLQGMGGRMVLCNLTGAVRDAFQITRLISSSRSSAAPFEVQPDVAAAIASLLKDTSPSPSPAANPSSGSPSGPAH